jgi:uncharacterized membrane protein YhaH (DUF805 family)
LRSGIGIHIIHGTTGETDISFGKAVSTCFSNYATFSGRAARSEYWYWTLFYAIADVVLLVVGLTSRYGVSLPVFALATMPPTAAVTIRRLHDTDHSGWAWLMAGIPGVGLVLFIVWLCKRGTDGPNRFGPSPA